MSATMTMPVVHRRLVATVLGVGPWKDQYPVSSDTEHSHAPNNVLLQRGLPDETLERGQAQAELRRAR